MAEESEVARAVEMTTSHHLSIISVVSYLPKVSVASQEMEKAAATAASRGEDSVAKVAEELAH